MGHGQLSAFTLKYRDSHNGSHSPLTFFANRGLLMWMSHFLLSVLSGCHKAHSGVRLLLLSSPPADIPLSSDD